MSMYDEVDKRILAYIKNNPGVSHASIFSALKLHDRVVDRRCQYLRKKGKIKFDSKTKWSANE